MTTTTAPLPSTDAPGPAPLLASRFLLMHKSNPLIEVLSSAISKCSTEINKTTQVLSIDDGLDHVFDDDVGAVVVLPDMIKYSGLTEDLVGSFVTVVFVLERMWSQGHFLDDCCFILVCTVPSCRDDIYQTLLCQNDMMEISGPGPLRWFGSYSHPTWEVCDCNVLVSMGDSDGRLYSNLYEVPLLADEVFDFLFELYSEGPPDLFWSTFWRRCIGMSVAERKQREIEGRDQRAKKIVEHHISSCSYSS